MAGRTMELEQNEWSWIRYYNGIFASEMGLWLRKETFVDKLLKWGLISVISEVGIYNRVDSWQWETALFHNNV